MKLGSVVYHCKRISDKDSEVEEFAPPIRYVLRFNYLSIQPKSGNIYQQTFGEFKDYEQQMCAQPYLKWENEIKEGDRFYIELEPDLDTDKIETFGYGYDANYKVVKRNAQNIAIFYALKSIVE